MSRLAHKIQGHRKIITMLEWAVYCGVARVTMYEYLRKYKKAGETYDSHNIYSILNFFRYLQKLIPDLRPAYFRKARRLAPIRESAE